MQLQEARAQQMQLQEARAQQMQPLYVIDTTRAQHELGHVAKAHILSHLINSHKCQKKQELCSIDGLEETPVKEMRAIKTLKILIANGIIRDTKSTC